jgi:SAM-dependent methyltransferase
MTKQTSATKFVIDGEFAEKTKDSFYDDFYTHVSNSCVESRKLGALEKCKSVMYLCVGMRFSKVAEIGCGLCSLLEQLDKHAFAKEFYGLEVSPSVIEYIKEKVNIPTLKTVYLLDTAHTSFSAETFDLCILSHVIEHVSDPCALVKEALRISNYVLIEVPLDANLSTFLWQKISGRNPFNNSAGHIQFFNKRAVHELVKASGGIVLKSRLYRPCYVIYEKPTLKVGLNYVKSALFFLTYKMSGSRIVGTHYALLIKKK